MQNGLKLVLFKHKHRFRKCIDVIEMNACNLLLLCIPEKRYFCVMHTYMYTGSY